MKTVRSSVKLTVLFSLCYLFHIHCSFANKPNLEHESPDSIFVWVSDSVQTYNSSLHEIAILGLEKAYQAKNLILISEFHKMLAYWHDYHEKFISDSVIHHYNKTIETYIKLDSLHLIPEIQLRLSIAHMNNDDVSTARELAFEAIEQFEKSKDQVGLADAYNSLANLHFLTDEPEECLKYARMSWQGFANLDMYMDQVNSSLALMECLCLLDQFESAHDIGKQNIELTKTHFPSQLGYIVRSLERMSEASIGLGNFDQAIDEAQELWDIAENAVGATQAAGHKYMLGKAYFANGQYEDALSVFEFIQSHRENDIEMWEMHQLMATAYSTLNKYSQAFESQQTAFALRGEVLDAKVNQLKSESFVKYETGKKDQAIASQQRELQQKTRIQSLSYGVGTLLLLLCGAVLFNYFRNKKYTMTLQEKNDENELLLKEIHHRVKNNLQTVSALLTLQGEKVKDESAKSAMQESQNRVEAMGLLHQKLYQGKNLGSIEMKDYFVNLSDGILESFNKEDQVKIELAMDQLELDIDTAVPIGLIVNELLTNALKYAFPPDYDAHIKIQLQEINQDQLLLKVADNGIGIQKDAIAQGTGFGTQLVNLLTKQLRGEIDKTIDNGTVVSLVLKKTKAA